MSKKKAVRRKVVRKKAVRRKPTPVKMAISGLTMELDFGFNKRENEDPLVVLKGPDGTPWFCFRALNFRWGCCCWTTPYKAFVNELRKIAGEPELKMGKTLVQLDKKKKKDRRNR
jgi:hypothetical protein